VGEPPAATHGACRKGRRQFLLLKTAVNKNYFERARGKETGQDADHPRPGRIFSIKKATTCHAYVEGPLAGREEKKVEAAPPR